jgi:hypothetical protein
MTKSAIKKRKTPPKPKVRNGEDSVHEPVRNVPGKTIRCEVDIDATRRIRCESGGGFFCFEFTNGAKTQRLKLTDDAAWRVREMLDAMHPRICGSNNPMWHKVQAMRRGDIIPNAEVSNGGTPFGSPSC